MAGAPPRPASRRSPDGRRRFTRPSGATRSPRLPMDRGWPSPSSGSRTARFRRASPDELRPGDKLELRGPIGGVLRLGAKSRRPAPARDRPRHDPLTAAGVERRRPDESTARCSPNSLGRRRTGRSAMSAARPALSRPWRPRSSSSATAPRWSGPNGSAPQEARDDQRYPCRRQRPGRSPH